MANKIIWTDEKLGILKKEYGKKAVGELSIILGVSKVAIYQRAANIGLRSTDSWTADDVKTLRKLFPKTDNEVIADTLGKTVSAIRNKAVVLKLKKAKWRWKISEERYIMDNYGKVDIEEMMLHLKKTKWSIINKYREMTGKRKTSGKTIISKISLKEGSYPEDLEKSKDKGDQSTKGRKRS